MAVLWVLCVAAFLQLAFAQTGCPDQWSATTWSFPDGGNVQITTDTIIRQSIDVQNVTVNSPYKLIVLDAANIVLRFRNLYVDGQLWVGSTTCPYQNQLQIVFTGPYASTSTTDASTAVKGLIANGQVELHGAPALPTWTTLTANAEINDTSITVADPVAWKVGDKIVISSTDFDQLQAEVVQVTQVSGNTIHFDTPLNYIHWGLPLKYVDQTAEVGRLTRSIQISGETVPNDPNYLGQWFGGHTMYLLGSTVHIDNVEFFAMGQGGVLARYPIHFHEGLDMTGSYVKECSFHDTFQRCLTVHWSDNLVIADNVAYNSSGHCYFFEEGVETGNLVEGNLGVLVNLVTDNQKRVIPSDLTQSAMFWITNPNNSFIDNVAAGGVFGFWYALPQHPIGLSGASGLYGATVWPRYTPVAKFQGNKAHSASQTGLFVDQGPSPTGDTSQLVSFTPRRFNLDPTFANAAVLTALETQIQESTPAPSYFENFTAHHCVANCVWQRGDNIVNIGARLSDCQAGLTMPGGPNWVRDSIFVGDSANPGNPPNPTSDQGRSRWYEWDPTYFQIGYQHYDCCGPNFLTNILFFNFTDFHFLFNGAVRKSGAISYLDGQHPIPPVTQYRNIQFEDVNNRVYIRTDPNQETALKGVNLVDIDGSITGKCGSLITANNPVLIRPQCTPYLDSMNAMYCPPGVVSPRYVQIQDYNQPTPTFSEALGASYASSAYSTPADNSTAYPTNQYGVGRMTITRVDDMASTFVSGNIPDGSTVVNNIQPYQMIYRQNLPTQTEYFFQFPQTLGTPSRVNIYLQNPDVSEWVRVAIPYPVGTTFPNFTYGGLNFSAVSTCDNIVGHSTWNNCPVLPVNSKAELNQNTYYWDNVNGLLWLHLQTPIINDYTYKYGYYYSSSSANIYITASCPSNQCNVSLDSLYYLLGSNGALAKQATPYQAPTTILCASNNVGDQGLLTYTSGGDATVVADDMFEGGWAATTWSYQAFNWTNTKASSGSSSMMITLGAWGSLQIQHPAPWPQPWTFDLATLASTKTDPTSELALLFDVIVAPAPTDIASTTQQLSDLLPLSIQFTDTLGNTYLTYANSPINTVPAPVDSTQWHHITLPFSSFSNGLPDNINVTGFAIGINVPYPATLYLDNVRFQPLVLEKTPMPEPSYETLTAASNLDSLIPLVSSWVAPQYCPVSAQGNGSGGGGSNNSSFDGKDAAILVLVVLLVVAVVLAGLFYHKYRLASSIPHLTSS